jgi:hypothetical protein
VVSAISALSSTPICRASISLHVQGELVSGLSVHT